MSYRAGDAHKSACERKRRPKVAKLARDAELAAAVAERLALALVAWGDQR